MEKKVFSYPEKIRKYRNGSTVTIPAYQIAFFYENGKEIAWLDKDGCLRLKTDFIKHKTLSDFKLPFSERIVGSQFEAQYRELLKEYDKISEYTNL